jgi:hypothetical protein
MGMEAAKRKAQAKGKPRGEKPSLGKQISPETKEERRTNTTLARSVGTNRAYVEAARNVLASVPSRSNVHVGAPGCVGRGRDGV